MPTFSELIRSEEEVLKRVLVAAQRQLEIAEAGNVTVLIQHLGQRQQLWNEFELLEQQLIAYKEIPPEHRVWENADERRWTELTLDRCKELLGQILENDEKSEALIAAQRNEVEKQLNRLQRGTPVATTYGRQSQLPQ